MLSVEIRGRGGPVLKGYLPTRTDHSLNRASDRERARSLFRGA
jgi:hypothetical protein